MENTNISIIQKSVDAIHRLSDDDKIREMVRLREEADALDRSRIYNAINQGRAEGRAERDSEILSRMKALGISESQIKAIFGEQKN